MSGCLVCGNCKGELGARAFLGGEGRVICGDCRDAANARPVDGLAKANRYGVDRSQHYHISPQQAEEFRAAMAKANEERIAKERDIAKWEQGCATITVVKRDPRVAELEKELAEHESNHAALLKDRNAQMQRANMLADTCGTLRDENTQLLAENARLRRGR